MKLISTSHPPGFLEVQNLQFFLVLNSNKNPPGLVWDHFWSTRLCGLGTGGGAQILLEWKKGDGIAVAVVNALWHQDIHVYHMEIVTWYRYIYIYVKNTTDSKTKKTYISGFAGSSHPGDNLNLANGFGIILSDKSVKWMWLYNCEVFLSVDGSFLLRSACWLGMLGFESGMKTYETV